jgi:hypothetical protein
MARFFCWNLFAICGRGVHHFARTTSCNAANYNVVINKNTLVGDIFGVKAIAPA